MEPILSVENLEKRYEGGLVAGALKTVTALRGISFSICAGSTLALVGESGSGKSTLALCIACLERPTSGRIIFNGNEITRMDEQQSRSVRPLIQLVFQDPIRSMNPRFSALEIVSEPLLVQGRKDKREIEARARSLLVQVGVSQQKVRQCANEFSGGQKQRLAIARALALEPKLLILDEALSALDCSVQAQIANLLVELQRSLGLTYLFITHDLAMAGHLADQIAVIARGKIVEQGDVERVLRAPERDITRRLIVATLRLGTSVRGPQVV